MPTCVEVAGAKYPTEFKEKEILPMEGRSLVSAFENKPETRGPLYWEHEGNRAVRDGNWKLVSQGKVGWELYDVDADRTETKNLAAKMPEKVADLTAKWNAWAKRANVLPRPKAK